MLKTTMLTGLMVALIGAGSSAFAAGQKYAPGQEAKGAHNSPGASYNSPGHEMQRNAPCSRKGPGASGCAPGQR